jgi:glycosyltransferase involved in cell wall biosynthesis
MSPLVSIGLPTYNRPLYLKRAIECLVNQSHKNIEIIISDDCFPSDDNKKITDYYIAQGFNLIYHRPEKNLGGADNHKRVLDLAIGDYFFWASDDDLWDKDFILEAVTILENDYRYDGWVSSFANMDKMGTLIRKFPSMTRFSSSQYKFLDLLKFLIEPESLGKTLIVHGIFRRKKLSEISNIYFWTKKNHWTDNSFVFGLLTKIDIYCSEKVMLYKGILDEDHYQRTPEPYVMGWKDYAGVPTKNYLFYVNEHIKSAENKSTAALAVAVLFLRFFMTISVKIYRRLKVIAH